MRIEQLKYFLEIVQTGSITAASENLFISQQSLCTSINRLEKELGLQLFHRSKRGSTLTEDGQILSVYITDIIDKYQVFENILTQLRQKEQPPLNGSLTLCVTPLLAGAVIPDLIVLIQQAYPQIHLNFLELTVTQILHYIVSKPSYLGLFLCDQTDAQSIVPALSDPDQPLAIQPLLADHMVACVAATSPYSLQKQISADEFYHATKISFNFDLTDPPEPESGKSGLFSSNNIKLHQKLIAENMAISSVPSIYFLSVFPTANIVAVPITPPIAADTFLAYSTQRLSPEASAAIPLIQRYMQKLAKERT